MNANANANPVPVEKPLPQPSALSKAYWDAAAQGRLVLQRCTACGKVRHYPRLICDACYSDAVEWVQSSGRAKVHSWTISHHAFHKGFASEVPYTIVTVDLEEGVRALGRWPTETPLKIGQPVQARFVTGNGRADLVFDPA